MGVLSSWVTMLRNYPLLVRDSRTVKNRVSRSGDVNEEDDAENQERLPPVGDQATSSSASQPDAQRHENAIFLARPVMRIIGLYLTI